MLSIVQQPGACGSRCMLHMILKAQDSALDGADTGESALSWPKETLCSDLAPSRQTRVGLECALGGSEHHRPPGVGSSLQLAPGAADCALCGRADQQAKASPAAEAAPAASASASADEQQRGARFEELKAQSQGRAPRADKGKRASFRDVVTAHSFYCCHSSL